ncbi:MAG: SAM-dependent methyltransferase [Cryomorphaceae bacterium]|jgi:SAM-dependent methyltransferase
MPDKQTISVYDSQVEDYADFISKASGDNDILLRFIERLKRDDLILDLGCGPAHDSAVMRQRGLKVDPVDASIEMVKFANKTFDIGARQALFLDIKEQNVYAAVWANFSLLHAPIDDFANILAAINTALKPSGVFHMAMKIAAGSDSHRDKLGRLYSYYSQDELCDHLVRAGFIVEDITLGEDLGMAGKVEPWIALLSRVE